MNLKLIPSTEADFPKLISWAFSEEFLLQWTGRTFVYPLDKVQLYKYYELSAGKNPLRVILKAVDEETLKHIGNITIDRVNSKKNEAALTCIIIGDKDYLGRGIGEFIIKDACRIAYENFGLEKIYLNVFDFNIKAIRCYLRCGFEEIFREKININGKEYVNVRMEKSSF